MAACDGWCRNIIAVNWPMRVDAQSCMNVFGTSDSKYYRRQSLWDECRRVSLCPTNWWAFLFHIKALRHIRQLLPTDICINLVMALVQSKLDYCNSLFWNAWAAILDKHQKIQNALTRTVFPHSRITLSELIKSLHWLPIRHRINCKSAVPIYNILASGHPVYLRYLLPVRGTVRT